MGNIFILIAITALVGCRPSDKKVEEPPVTQINGEQLFKSCASCHKPTEYFTDTGRTTSMQFDNRQFLSRNTPSLINATYNHLLMLDGRHISLMGQAKDVATIYTARLKKKFKNMLF